MNLRIQGKPTTAIISDARISGNYQQIGAKCFDDFGRQPGEGEEWCAVKRSKSLLSVLGKTTRELAADDTLDGGRIIQHWTGQPFVDTREP